MVVLQGSRSRGQQEALDAEILRVESAVHSASGAHASDHEEGRDVEYLPPAEECIRTGVMQKKSIDTRGVLWEDRYLALTRDRLLISKVEDESRRVFDYVLLKDIVECEIKEGSALCLCLAGFALSSCELSRPLSVCTRRMICLYQAIHTHLSSSSHRPRA